MLTLANAKLAVEKVYISGRLSVMSVEETMAHTASVLKLYIFSFLKLIFYHILE